MDAGLPERLEERLVHRQLFFSDAVFAIVLTLLALDLKPPSGAVADAAALRALGGRLFTFAMSFALIAIFWAAHMNSTRRLRRHDWPTAWANLLFLFPICLIPFVSSWLGTGMDTLLAWQAYAAVLVGASAGNVVLILISTRRGGRLVGDMTPRMRLYVATRAACPGVVFAAVLAFASLGWLHAAQLAWIGIPVLLVTHRQFLSLAMREPIRAEMA